MFSTFTLTLAILLLSVLALTASKPTKPPGMRKPGVELTSTSQFVIEGFTKTLSINCSHTHKAGSDDVTASLVLSKTDSVDGTSYTNIAALNFANPDHVTVNSDLGADVTGKLSAAGTSHVSYQWKYPSLSVEGLYRCSVHILPRIGHPVTATATTAIGQKSVNIQEVLDKLKQMDIQQERLIVQLNNTSSQLVKTRSQAELTVRQLNTTLDKTSADLEDTRNQLSSLLSHYTPVNQSVDDYLATGFVATSTYKGHTYELSRIVMNDVLQFNSICRLKGGYLVEINDLEEYNHVVSFLAAHNKPVTAHLMVSMSDDGHQGSWTYVHSGGPVTYTRWAGGQPSASVNHDCAYLHMTNNLLYSYPCINTLFPRFICEINS